MKASFEIYILLLQKEEKQESRKLQLRNPKIRSQHLLPELLEGHKVSTGTKEYNQPAVQFETLGFIPSSTFLLHYHCLNLVTIVSLLAVFEKLLQEMNQQQSFLWECAQLHSLSEKASEQNNQ
jgi:hypothetical protein